jgi:hypothetical protein
LFLLGFFFFGLLVCLFALIIELKREKKRKIEIRLRLLRVFDKLSSIIRHGY